MNLRTCVRHLLCPSCIEMESRNERGERAVSIMERSSESLNRIAEELRDIQNRMAQDRHPLLGDRPEERP